ncbi:MAG: hypothetical protein HYS43_00900 [Candidatus Liptonbacteria bacterium]|nr:hypothetical protein [Candidatus Liptonbacteria bacterium]
MMRASTNPGMIVGYDSSHRQIGFFGSMDSPDLARIQCRVPFYMIAHMRLCNSMLRMTDGIYGHGSAHCVVARERDDTVLHVRFMLHRDARDLIAMIRENKIQPWFAPKRKGWIESATRPYHRCRRFVGAVAGRVHDFAVGRFLKIRHAVAG